MALLLVVLAVGGCGHPIEGPPAVSLREFDIAPTGLWEPGHSRIAITNTGRFAHTLVITDSAGRVVDATDLIEPGTEVEMDVDLSPGTYQLTCRIVVEFDGEVVDHYGRGMAATVRLDEGVGAG